MIPRSRRNLSASGIMTMQSPRQTSGLREGRRRCMSERGRRRRRRRTSSTTVCSRKSLQRTCKAWRVEGRRFMPTIHPMILRLVWSGGALQAAKAATSVSGGSSPLSFATAARLANPFSARRDFRSAPWAQQRAAWPRARAFSRTAACALSAHGDGKSGGEPLLRAPALSLEAEQLALLTRQGFCVVERDAEIIGDAQLAQLEALNTDILAYLKTLMWSPRYLLWRMFSHVSRPSQRHSIPLPASPALLSSLKSSIGATRCLSLCTFLLLPRL